MKLTNYAEKIRRRKQFLKQNKIKPPVALPKTKRSIWAWRLAGVIISLIVLFIVLPLIAPFLVNLGIDTELRAEWLSYQNVMFFLSVVAIAFLVVIIWAAVWIGPKVYVRSLKNKSLNNNQSEFDREKETLKLEDDTRKTFAQLAGGAVFLFTILSTYNAFVLDREGQIAERYDKAVSQLGAQDIGVRSGALYALERIAKDSPKDHWTIMEILSSYIREKSSNKKPANPAQTDQKTQSNSVLNKKPANSVETDRKTQSNSTSNNSANPAEIDQKKQSNSTEAKQAEDEAVKADVQTALTIIGRRASQQDPPTTKSNIDLSYLDLRRANLYRADLKNANLNGSKLNKASFIGANLTNARFIVADLFGGHLNLANLTDTDLSRANLKSAVFAGAKLRRANFQDAYLNGANLSEADLEGALNLTFEQIATAIIDENTILPKYLESRRQELLDISKKNLEEKKGS